MPPRQQRRPSPSHAIARAIAGLRRSPRRDEPARARAHIPRGRRRARRDRRQRALRTHFAETESQFAENSTARRRSSHHAEAGAGVRPGTSGGQRERAALDRELAPRQSELVPPERMAKMLSEIVKRNPDIELVSLRTLPATGLTQSLTAISGSAPDSPAIYRHGIEIAVSGNYLKMLNYVGQLERLPAKIMWGNMELQSAYPVVTLKITFYTLSPEKTWLLI